MLISDWISDVCSSDLLTKTFSRVGKAQQELQNMYATESGFTAVYEVIDDASREREVASGKFAPTFDRQLRFRDVSFAFGAHQILRHANFTLNSGEIVALTGPSGAGKTTLVDLLLGLQVPSRGNIAIDDVYLTDIALIKWRGQTGYVPQALLLFPDTNK